MASPRSQKRCRDVEGTLLEGAKRQRVRSSPASPTQRDTDNIQSNEALPEAPCVREAAAGGDPVKRMLYILKFLSRRGLGTVERTVGRKSLQELLPLLRVPQELSRTSTAIADTMEAFSRCLSIQLEATRVMHAVLDNNATCDIAKRAIDSTMTCLLNFPYDSSLHCLGIDLLRKLKVHLVQGDDKIRATCVIFNSHRNHRNVDFLQQVSLCLLAWLVEDKTCRKVLYRLGGIDSILKTMSHYPADPMVQCNATAIICWMVHGSTPSPSDEPESVDGQRIQTGTPALERWSFPIVLRALTDHFEEVSVFGNCVCLLSGVPNLPAEATVLELVRLGMKTHKTSAKAQEACLRWLRYRNPRQYTNQIIKCLPLLLEAMEVHAMDRNVQAQACEVLVMLLDVPETRAAVLEHRTVDVVLQALANHKTDGHIQHAAIWFLTLLLPFNEESASQREATAAFGGGFLCLETVWKGLGISSDTPPPGTT